MQPPLATGQFETLDGPFLPPPISSLPSVLPAGSETATAVGSRALRSAYLQAAHYITAFFVLSSSVSVRANCTSSRVIGDRLMSDDVGEEGRAYLAD